jgi:hypothetical protein
MTVKSVEFRIMTEPETIQSLFEQLMAAQKFEFPRSPTRVEAPWEQGVYIIYDPHDAVAHVGRKLGEYGLFGRMGDHINGYSSFHQHPLKPEGQKVSDGFLYAWLTNDSPRTRALLEAYATGRLCPAHIGANVEEAKQREAEESSRQCEISEAEWDEMMRDLGARD